MLSMCIITIEDLTEETIGEAVIKAREDLNMLCTFRSDIDQDSIKNRYYESVPYNEEQTKILKEIVESDLFVIPSFVYATILLKQTPSEEDYKFVYNTMNSILFNDEECKELYMQVKEFVEKYEIVDIKDRLDAARIPEMIGKTKMLCDIVGVKESNILENKTIKLPTFKSKIINYFKKHGRNNNHHRTH